MADDLASQLADAITRAAGRMADRTPHSMPPGKVSDQLAADLRRILSTSLPEWYAGYEAGCREQAAAVQPKEGWPDRLPPLPDGAAGDPEEGGYSAPDWTPDERHRHTIGGQTWEHAHEGGHEAHSAVTHDLSGTTLVNDTRDPEVVAALLHARTLARRILRAGSPTTPGFAALTISDFYDAATELCEYVLSLDDAG